ncbi:MAG TPA: hypothetical protein DCW47_01785 [Lachnospiraceae bacterium]|nr:hypothetical protein [Lachnospiraceae bacterium]
MLTVRLSSGLGNQMFQYCFYLLLKKLYPGAQVRADLTWFYANNDHHGYELQRIFGKNGSFLLEEASFGELFRVCGMIPNCLMPADMQAYKNGKEYHGRFSEKQAAFFEEFRRYPNRVIREFTLKKRLPYMIDEGGSGPAAMLGGSKLNNDDIYRLVNSLDLSKDYYFTGFWISERYFGQVLPEARRAFTFLQAADEENKSIIREIGERPGRSVSLHVRRGDYLTVYKDQFRVLTREYYERAVEAILERTGLDMGELKFYIFSDDSDFAMREFDFLENKRVVTHNRGKESYRDMQLMSLCSHNIIANSTFSQWAALLNKNEGQLTIYPRAYLKDQDNEEKTLKGWIML